MRQFGWTHLVWALVVGLAAGVAVGLTPFAGSRSASWRSLENVAWSLGSIIIVGYDGWQLWGSFCIEMMEKGTPAS